MTISEAIASEIQPFSTSDETLEKMFIDAADKFGIEASVADEYSVAEKKPVAYAAMRILYKMNPLSSENIGGISQSYKNDKNLIDKMIKSIAKDAGLDADLVIDSTSDDYWIQSVKVW
jgi:hypothetical protein